MEVKTCNYDETCLVYSSGDVFNLKTDKLKIWYRNSSTSPYLYTMFWVKGKQKKLYQHRLVAEHFLENPNNLRDVHHKDNDPTNNDVSNLEWMSHRDNCLLKQKTVPFATIKNNPNAYIRKIIVKGVEKHLFVYVGGWSDIPKISRTFYSREDAIKCRDDFFKDFIE